VYFGRWKDEFLAPLCCALEKVAKALRRRGSRRQARRYKEEAAYMSKHAEILENRMWTEWFSERLLVWCAQWQEKRRIVIGDF